MDLFVYGTLMVPEVMSAVCGYEGPGESAQLPGFKRRRVVGESYPGIVACVDEVVDGTVYRNVDDESCRRLDAFEGRMYRRLPVRITTASGSCDAQAYVLESHSQPLLSNEHWSLERFLDAHLDSFMSDYAGFLALR